MEESERLLLALFKMVQSGEYNRRTVEQAREYLDIGGFIEDEQEAA